MGVTKTKIINIIFLSLILLMLLPSLAVAFSDDIERYTTDWTEKYTIERHTYEGSNENDVSRCTASAGTAADPRLPGQTNTVLALTCGQTTYVYWNTLVIHAYLVPKEGTSSVYFSFTSPGYTQISSTYRTGTVAKVERSDTKATLAQFSPYYRDAHAPVDTKFEIVKNGNFFNLYANGVLVEQVANQAPSYTGTLLYCAGTCQDCNSGGTYQPSTTYIDDLTDSSIIGSSKIFTDASTNITFTWAAQLMRSYTDQYTITLNSLTNQNNVGQVAAWNIPQQDNSSSSEHGYLNFSRSSTLGSNFGLYDLQMLRAGTVLTDTYFYYDQLANPQGFPPILFLASSSVNADIRDDDNNGGEVTAGGSVYLYPSTQASGIYNFTCELLETPYLLDTEIGKVYNTSSLNGSYIHYSGLNQNYIISVNGAQVGTNNGSSTWDYFINWTSNSYTISFAPDYTKAGVWGNVKNSVTQKPIKSAYISVTGDNYSKYVYTDENGYYYLTQGMEAGKTYNITVSKTGYAATNPETFTAEEGKTTRKDYFLDSTSGEGIYYAPHSVTFTVLEYWFNYTGLQGIPYYVYDNSKEEEIKAGSTDSKGQFTVKEMDGGTNYTITLTYNGKNVTEYIEPGLSEYNLILNKEGVIHTYMNSWLTLTYSQNSTNAIVTYNSNKTISQASLIATASNGTIAYNQTLSTQTGTFNFPFSPGDYSLQFNITASDGSKASQVWTISNPPTVNLFPSSYPTWLKNTLFTAIILIFLLAFGKSKNDVACGSVAVLTSLGYIFHWLTCSFNFVILVWIIAIAAILLHYKRTGALG